MNQKLLHFLLISAVGCALCACDAEKLTEPDGFDDCLRISAKEADMLHSRAYTHDDNGGIVKTGIYYLYYPSTAANNAYTLATVDFDDETGSQGSEIYGGRYYVPTKPELKWSNITDKGAIYLDNVKPSYGGSLNNNGVMTFNATNPFVAGLMQDENDLLWGDTVPARSSNRIDFNLHHAMSAVRVKITVDNKPENLTDWYDLTKAEVYITNLIHKPSTYSRKTGTVTVAEDAERQNLMLVDNLTDEGSGQGWFVSEETQDIVEIDPSTGLPVYTSQNFILPPQSVSQDERPMLVVRIPNPTPEEAEKKPIIEFYGYLPRAMVTDYTANNVTMELAFLREHILEIRTKITQTPPELVFMPVKVYDWVPWGPYTLNAYQEGIYSTDALKFVINSYQQYSPQRLERYGELKDYDGTKRWCFNIFKNLTVYLEDIQGAMKQETQEYAAYFDLNMCTVKILDSNGVVKYVLSGANSEDNDAFNNLITKGVLPSE